MVTRLREPASDTWTLPKPARARASRRRSRVSRARARPAWKWLSASSSRPRYRKSVPRFSSELAWPLASPTWRARIQAPCMLLQCLAQAPAVHQDVAQVAQGMHLPSLVARLAGNVPRLREARRRVLQGHDVGEVRPQRSPDLGAAAGILAAIGEGDRLVERGRSRVAAAEEVEADRLPQQQLAALPPRDETRHGERAVGEAQPRRPGGSRPRGDRAPRRGSAAPGRPARPSGSAPRDRRTARRRDPSAPSTPRRCRASSAARDRRVVLLAQQLGEPRVEHLLHLVVVEHEAPSDRAHEPVRLLDGAERAAAPGCARRRSTSPTSAGSNSKPDAGRDVEEVALLRRRGPRRAPGSGRRPTTGPRSRG